MPILNVNGGITVTVQSTDIELTRLNTDPITGADRFEFPDSTLVANHHFITRDLGRKVGSDGLVSRKGKVSILKEMVTPDGKRRVLSQSSTLSTQGDFTEAEVAASIEALGNYLVRNAAELAKGQFDL